MANRSFVFNDITISRRTDINIIGSKWAESDCQQPNDLLDWDTIVPKMDIGLDVASNEMHYVTSIIPTLKWRGGKLGVRLAFLPNALLRKTQTTNAGIIPQDAVLVYAHCAEILNHKSIHKMKRRFALS